MSAWLLDEWRNALAPLQQGAPLTAEGLAYLRYYGLELTNPGIEQRIGTLEVAAYRLLAQSVRPVGARATLVLLHGYYDHLGLYGHLVRWAVSQGFAVIGCDLPGHGLSSGARASIGEFAEYQQVLKALLACARALTLPQPWHLCGQSTGAAIALDYLLHEPEAAQLGRSVLLAPLVRPRAWRRSELSYVLARRWIKQLPRRFTENSTDTQFVNFIKAQDPLQPRYLPTAWVGALSRWVKHIEAAPSSAHAALIIQGCADQTVDWTHNLKVLQNKMPNGQTLLLPAARHHLANEAPSIRSAYLQAMAHALG